MYSYVGSIITTEGTNIAVAAYSGLWYRRLSNQRKYYLQLIQFSQKSRYLTGFRFFDCSMETYSWVCNDNIIKDFEKYLIKIFFLIFM